MKTRPRKLLAILKPLVMFVLFVAVLILPFVQFVYAVAYGLSDNGESELHTALSQYPFHLMLVTSPCLYSLALYMLRDLRALLPDKAFFAASERILRWVLHILLGLSCVMLAGFIVMIGVEYLL